MENKKILLVSILSVFIYLNFIYIIDIFNEFLLWAYFISHKGVFILSNIILSLMSLYILYFLFRYFLVQRIAIIKSANQLLGLLILLTIILYGIEYYNLKYIENINFDKKEYLSYRGWQNIFTYFTKLLALVLFYVKASVLNR